MTKKKWEPTPEDIRQAAADRRKHRDEYSIYQLAYTDPTKDALLSTLNSSAKKIDVSNSNIKGAKDRGLEILFRYSASHPVERVNLSQNQLKLSGSKAVARGLLMNKSLTELDMTNNDMKASSKKAIGQALLTNKEAPLKYFKCDEWSINEGDTEIQFNHKMLKPSDFILMASLMARNDRLTSIDLSHNMGGRGLYQGSGQYEEVTDGIQALLDALHPSKSVSSVTSLNLAHNNIKSIGAQLIADALTENYMIRTLVLSGNQLVMNGPGSMDASGVISLAGSLMSNTTLTSLDLSANQLGCFKDQYQIVHNDPVALESLIAAVSQSGGNLKELNMELNHVRPELVRLFETACSQKKIVLHIKDQAFMVPKLAKPKSLAALGTQPETPTRAPLLQKKSKASQNKKLVGLKKGLKKKFDVAAPQVEATA
jgi:Leucine-rich repeat (LRR) protein